MVEGLPKLLNSITELKMTPDADLPWLIQLETIILEKVRNDANQVQQQVPGGLPIGPLQAPTPQGPMGGPGRMGGVQMQSAPPNPDELRRILGA